MSEIKTIKNRPYPCPTGWCDCLSCQFRDGDNCKVNDLWYMKTPLLRALTKLLNMYYFFKAVDTKYVLTKDELIALQNLIKDKTL